ncbi:alpha/beta hydrolase [Micromonospora sp. PLK6-60]|uniref:alpha/beta fold hydrolase n=1 Tax=Micromonospora sp. PLK6-60 TaxID=2873383 RepID=UPI001CA7AB6B|nr:alpha/beta hydrolase [Micromonospora sp. PLK6-60]MBY8870793.1 alpha/beta hydrolase [Micromonospora sp. PLK6-60]
MEFKALDVPVNYVEYGDGTPVLVLHGANVDHREMTSAMEPIFDDVKDHRRIYPDLPAMGHTPAPETLNSGDDVLDLLLAFVDGVVGKEPFRLIGHSAGAYYARAIAGRRPKQVSGLALICPLGEHVRDVPAHQVLHDSVDRGDTLDPAEESTFRDYFVVQTPATLERFREYVAPSAELADDEGLARIGANWMFSTSPEKGPKYASPALIVTGRQDSMVGYAGPWDLLEHYPRATFAVLDRAGHALPHEQPDLLKALITEWLDRAREHDSA